MRIVSEPVTDYSAYVSYGNGTDKPDTVKSKNYICFEPEGGGMAAIVP